MYVQTHYYFKKVWELHIYDLMEITLYLLKIVIWLLSEENSTWVWQFLFQVIDLDPIASYG